MISILKATEHNLKSVSVEIPHRALTVITGVSGSGKSTLAFDTLYREGQRRTLGSFSAFARQFMGKLGRPSVEAIYGISPTLSVDQKSVVRNPRSTVGTLSEIYDYLRLLFARLGDGPCGTTSSFFSFNSPAGACTRCKGLGVEDRIDPELLIRDPTRTLREGALSISTPNGYIIYSQVTIDVLDQVCKAHGFSVDIPWQALGEPERDVVLNGSARIRIPYGKHPLESRLKWSGITARPREEGVYKGILPVMNEILKRDRNRNILRFARTQRCSVCQGSRLNGKASSVRFHKYTVPVMAAMPVAGLSSCLRKLDLSTREAAVGKALIDQIIRRADLLCELGLGYLSLERESTTLSGGEAQRIRLATQVGSGLQGILYVLDEPSIGLHAQDHQRLMAVLERLRDQGNTVVIVEYDETTQRGADWLVDVGPFAGEAGGEILYCGPVKGLKQSDFDRRSLTADYLFGRKEIPIPPCRREGNTELRLSGASGRTLATVDAVFKLNAFNVVTGLAGSGKSTLVNGTLVPALKARLGMETRAEPLAFGELTGAEQIDKLIEIDQGPIGKNPRSNPATYTKMFDLIRNLFAELPEAVALGLGKGHFSFNQKGGRCETCQGASVVRIGMHFIDDVDVHCDACDGRRFDDRTLSVRLRGKSIFDILEMSVSQAADFFYDQPGIFRTLHALLDVGLGYLKLGQPSTTLSGGEAQRVKLAAQLARPASGKTLYILIEPTTGLHAADISVLLKAFCRLIDAGNTLVVIEHHLDLIKTADWVIDLGATSHEEGSRIVCMGTPEQVADCPQSITGRHLKAALSREPMQAEPQSGKIEPSVDKCLNTGSSHGTARAVTSPERSESSTLSHLTLSGVRTHNLKNIKVRIPHDKLTVITGVSGSGKSSLAFDSIHAEGLGRFSECLSTQARRYFKQLPRPPIDEVEGLRSTIGIGQQRAANNPRSTVGTTTEIYDLYRLLYSRAGEHALDFKPSASLFSFNHHLGFCPRCRGLGTITVCDAGKLISHAHRSIMAGAMDGHKTGRFFGERGGRHLAILEEVGRVHQIDFSLAFAELPDRAREIALHGTADQEYDVVWKYNRKGREGEHALRTPWQGMCGYVEEEYARVHADHRGESMLEIMRDDPCSECRGERLRPEALSVRFAGLSIAELCRMSVQKSILLFEAMEERQEKHALTETARKVSSGLRQEILSRLQPIQKLGLGYLSLDRLMATLSGGELTRIRLAAQIGTGLSGVIYVLDEPTMGLHPIDTQRLIDLLKDLRDHHNTVIVVEHDEEIIRAADHIIDMGPGAGSQGGQVMAEGDPDYIEENRQSLTGCYLAGIDRIEYPKHRRTLRSGLSIRGAHINNLKGFDLEVPAGGIIALTGPSGSGKSSVAFDLLAASYEEGRAIGCEAFVMKEKFEALVKIDPSSISASPLSCPATYTRLFDRIRALFSKTVQAEQLGFKKARFSFSSHTGRCNACGGKGQIKVELGFLADQWIPCDGCDSKRYNAETLKIKYREKSIADILTMTITEALDFFSDQPCLASGLAVLEKVGLGYMTLGQSAPSLSGGEAQRLKLAAGLIPKGAGQQATKNKQPSLKKLYLFDEPTVGLHFADVARLVFLLHELADQGHTLLVIEHNLDVIKNADWIIDLGPGGGDEGGSIVAAGTPEEVAGMAPSRTGCFISALLSS
ncbi:MAG: excinuclease ABC subunit UvrA [Planctomycetota bacterium]